ncbi:hypothetical protein B0H14DRAFT_3450896 [Mycena olivaceomarginata]|nr:hypothetical protein B0H14DRAFT_3450896 [Mycena olivaceomarginata]
MNGLKLWSDGDHMKLLPRNLNVAAFQPFLVVTRFTAISTAINVGVWTGKEVDGKAFIGIKLKEARAEELQGLTVAQLQPPPPPAGEFFGPAGTKQVREHFAAQLDLAVVKLFSAAGLPLALAHYPEWKEIFGLAVHTGPGSLPPTADLSWDCNKTCGSNFAVFGCFVHHDMLDNLACGDHGVVCAHVLVLVWLQVLLHFLVTAGAVVAGGFGHKVIPEGPE